MEFKGRVLPLVILFHGPPGFLLAIKIRRGLLNETQRLESEQIKDHHLSLTSKPRVPIDCLWKESNEL